MAIIKTKINSFDRAFFRISGQVRQPEPGDNYPAFTKESMNMGVLYLSEVCQLSANVICDLYGIRRDRNIIAKTKAKVNHKKYLDFQHQVYDRMRAEK